MAQGSPKETTRDALITAIGVVSAIVSLQALSGATLLAALGGIFLTAGFLIPRHILRLCLWALGIALVLAASATLVAGRSAEDEPADGQTERKESAWGTSRKGLGAADRPHGYFPARRARMCRVTAGCSNGLSASLNALVFSDGGFLQGTEDERRFLAAQPVTSHEWLEPLDDPLTVRPGDHIRVTGLIDNGGRKGAKGTARNVRALIALPPAAGRRIDLLSAVSSLDADPAAVSDSVTIQSDVPIFLAYERTTAFAYRPEGTAEALEPEGYRLPDHLVTWYVPDRLDRRQLAGQGVLVGCRKPDGVMPPGRECALRFQAILDVLYAATEEDVNSLGNWAYPSIYAAAARIRGERVVSLYWSPEWGEPGELRVPASGKLRVDCRIKGDGSTWYHVSNAEFEARNSGFVNQRRISSVRGRLPRCAT